MRKAILDEVIHRKENFYDIVDEIHFICGHYILNHTSLTMRDFIVIVLKKAL